MKLASRMIPKGLQERAKPAMDRGYEFLRTFEWTWTKAAVATLVLWFIGVTFIVIIPSWWLYFADQKLGWRETRICDVSWFTHNCGFWLFKLRDLVAIVLFSLPFGAFLVIPYHIQKLRRKLRSESESRPIGGYR